MFRSIQSRRKAVAALAERDHGADANISGPRKALAHLMMQQATRADLVVIDPSVPDIAAIVAALPRDVPCALLPSERGLRALVSATADRRVDTVHLFCGGAADALRIGGMAIDLADPPARDAALLDAFSRIFVREAGSDAPALLIYGSPFGLGTAGRNAASNLARLAGVSVGATADAEIGDAEPNWHLQIVNDATPSEASAIDGDPSPADAGAADAPPDGGKGPAIPSVPTDPDPHAGFEFRPSEDPISFLAGDAFAAAEDFDPLALVSRNPRIRLHRAAGPPTGPEHDPVREPAEPVEAAEEAEVEATADRAEVDPIEPATPAEVAPSPETQPVVEAPQEAVEAPVARGSSPRTLTSFSIEAVVRPDDGDEEATIAELGDLDGGIALRLDGPTILFGVSRKAAFAEAKVDLTTLGMDDHSTALTHIVGTADEAGWLRLYVDGALAGTARLAPRELSWSVSAEAPDTSAFEGDIALLRLHSQAIAAPRVAELHAADEGRDEALAGVVWETGTYSVAGRAVEPDTVDASDLEPSPVGADVTQEPAETGKLQPDADTRDERPVLAEAPSMETAAHEPIMADASLAEMPTETEPTETAPTEAAPPEAEPSESPTPESEPVFIDRSEPIAPALRSAARIRALRARSGSDASPEPSHVVLAEGAAVTIDALGASGCTLHDPVAFWPVRVPEWLDLDPVTAKLSGEVPRADAVGAHAVTIVAANRHGTTATLNITLTVRAVAVGAGHGGMENRMRASLDALPALRALAAAGRALDAGDDAGSEDIAAPSAAATER